MTNNLYKEDSIESLSPREHVRLRPGVYVGDTSTPNQLLTEIFANALDEHNIGHGNKIIVNILDNGVISVEDHGQGFPINVIRPEDGKTVLEAAFSVMNTSGKFSDEGVYEGTSLGLNGMGGKLATFLSKWFEVISFNNGQYEHLWFKDGVFQKREVGKWGKNPDHEYEHGTTITYKPDSQFFDTDKTDTKFFENFFHDICCLCPDLTIVLNQKNIQHPNGIAEILPRKLGNSIETINSPLIIQETKGKNEFALALTFTGSSSSNIIPYVNFGYTNSGPHITAIKSTITRVVNNWAKENGLLKKNDKNLDGNSIQEGMLLICNIITNNVSYNAQVKTTVTKIDTSFVTSVFSKNLEVWLDNHPEDATSIIKKALLARKAAEAAKKAREAVKSKNAANKKEKVFKLPTTLDDCWTKNRNEAELFICEGKSAASGLIAARDSEFQAVYGVRGKMLSVLKSTPSAILKNQEINNLIQALGLDCDEKTAKLTYDKNKLRYNKIIACTDADPDGHAIENLLFNILWYLCPDLIIEGHVYSAVPPLYRITNQKNEYIYIKGDVELAEYKKQFGEKSIKILSRNKGLGEQDSDELSYTLLEKETRNVLQLNVEDIGKMDQTFKDLYGKDVKPRVKFLLEHGEEANG